MNELVILVENAKNDPDSFGALYDLYYDKILNYSFRRVLNIEVSQDVTANTFFKVLKNIKKFKWNGGGFNGWIYRIATNEINLYFRKQNKYKSLDEDKINYFLDEGQNHNTEEDKMLKDDSFLILNKALRQLKTTYQDIIYLKFFEELTHAEIAESIHKNESSIRVYLHRALKDLKIILQKDADLFLKYLS